MKKRNKKAIGFAAVLSAVLIMTGTAFADGAAAVFSDNSAVEITASGKKIELADKPFVKNGEIYIPVREFLKNVSPKTQINWNDGRISLVAEFKKADGTEIEKKASFVINKPLCTVALAYTDANDGHETTNLKNVPVLVDDKTYIPYELALTLDEKMALTDGFAVSVGENDGEILKKAAAWAEALKTRDGKPRYEMMNEKIQQDFIAGQKELIGSDDWKYVIGVSSPWVVSYDIAAEGSCAYITYFETESTGMRCSVSEKLTFEKKDGSLVVCAAENMENTSL